MFPRTGFISAFSGDDGDFPKLITVIALGALSPESGLFEIISSLDFGDFVRMISVIGRRESLESPD
jgi:hypothetical protein